MRLDIQTLRGYAVLLVVLDHFKIGPFAHGYLGVDIFFVISGFLITRIIVRDLGDGSFSFASFYMRRAKRLLPAAYVTIFLTVIAARWFLPALELNDLSAQVYGALTWTINFVLLSQTDYFAVSANMKPLLHLWSLAVEEQFYLIIPALLFFSPAVARRWVVVFVLVASAGLCFFLVRDHPAAAFYMLPTRAWELAIGGIGALFTFNPRLIRTLFPVALVVLALLPVWAMEGAHPGLNAALVCCATLAVILKSSENFGKTGKWLGLKWLGDISYSLYLIHWPIAAFMNNATMTEALPLSLRMAGLVLSVLCATVLYYLIERPIHRSSPVAARRLLATAIPATAMLASLQFASARADGEFLDARRANVGLSVKCSAAASLTLPECKTSEAPQIAIWGDSYAMALVEGVRNAVDRPIIQITMSACPPVIDLAFNRVEFDNPTRWALNCIKYNELAVDFLVNSTTIDTVVMSSPLRVASTTEFFRQEGGSLDVMPSSNDLLWEHLSRAVERLKDADKRVIFVGPPPPAGDGMSACAERRSRSLVTIGGGDCTFPFRENATTLDMLERLTSIVKVVRLSDALCVDDVCQSTDGRVPFYRDAGHLSYSGSAIVVRRSELPELLHSP